MSTPAAGESLSIAVAQESEVTLVERLLQLYLYDMAEFTGDTLDPSTGQFPYDYLNQYWTDPERSVYLFRVAGQPVGFCFTNRWTLFSDPPESAQSIAEFFVLKQYRRSGVGQTAAISILEAGPGDWEIRAFANNGSAVVFWGSVAAALRNRGHHSEILHSSDDCYSRFVWRIRMQGTTG